MQHAPTLNKVLIYSDVFCIYGTGLRGQFSILKLQEILMADVHPNMHLNSHLCKHLSLRKVRHFNDALSNLQEYYNTCKIPDYLSGKTP